MKTTIRKTYRWNISLITIILFLGGSFISACASNPTLSAIVPLPIASDSATFTPLPPTSTYTLIPSETYTVTLTETLTDPPTSTRPSYSYVFPLQPSSGTGFAEGTASHGYPAIDIFAIIGTKYVAVTDGQVDFVSYEDTWDPSTDDPAVRGGLSVAIIGLDGVRYYGSHLSAIAEGIKPGLKVTAGQLLGLVGKSGNARNTTSHLHFGISRPTTPEDWKARRGQVDPFPFIQAWKDGHNVTPPLPIP